MKKLFFFLSFVLFAAVTSMTFAQEQMLSPKATAKGLNAEVTYGQPSKRNRTIFGDVVPYNEVWRTGANEATEITFKKNVTFAGKPVQAGTYTLFTIPAEKEWTVILNGKLGQWGAFDYEANKAKNVAEVKVPVHHMDKSLEKLTYTIKNDALVIEWDKTGVSVPLKY